VLAYIVRRVIIGAVTILLIGTIAFFVVTLPSGDYLDSYIDELETYGQHLNREEGKLCGITSASTSRSTFSM